MNVNEFLELTFSSGRKLQHDSADEKDIQILEASVKGIRQFFIDYERHFKNHLSQKQKAIIHNIIELCQGDITKNNYAGIIEKLNQFNQLGVNILVRHPEPLLSSYNKLPGKNLALRGVIQVWNFNKKISRLLSAHSKGKVVFYVSDSARTQVFARLCKHYLQRHAGHLEYSNLEVLDILAGSGPKVEDVKSMYPEYRKFREENVAINSKTQKETRKYFRKWISEAKLAQQTANDIERLLSTSQNNTINIFFSHENVIGAFLYHKLNIPIDKVLIKYARFIIASDGLFYVNF